MEVMAFLFSSNVVLFSVCIIAALFFGFLVMLGFDDMDMDADATLDVDADVDINAEIPVLSWLGFGKVPLFFLIMALLSSFGFIGLLIQTTVLSLAGFSLPWWLAAFVSLFPSALLTKVFSSFMVRFLPQVEDYSENLANLVGDRAEVTVPAQQGKIGEAKIVDRFGSTQYIRVKMTSPVAVGDEILLASYSEETRAFEGGKQ